jgi:hypothetical protein
VSSGQSWPNPAQKVVLAIGVPIALLVGPFIALGALTDPGRPQPNPGDVVTTGTVVDLHFGGNDRQVDAVADIAFRDRRGQRHVFSGEETETPPSIGAHVRVSYAPEDPTQARDLSWSGGTTRTITLVLGLIVTVGMPVVIRRGYRLQYQIENQAPVAENRPAGGEDGSDPETPLR